MYSLLHSIMDTFSMTKRRKLNAAINDDSPTIEKPSECHSDQRSFLESLPRELFAMIVEYTSETVHDLRLTSSRLKSHVDILATRPSTFQLVQHMEFGGPDWRESGAIELMVLVKVPKNMMNLFELRLKLCQPKPKMAIPIERQQYTTQYMLWDDEEPHDLQSYVIRLTEQDDIPGSLTYLKSSVGRRVGFVYFSLAFESNPVARVALIRDGLNIDHLRIKISVLSTKVGDQLLAAIKNGKVSKLSIETVCSAPDPSFDAGRFLTHVASLVNSIHIEQYYNSKIDHQNYLLGAIDVDWAPIILEMFSRKLSKLFIKNFAYPGYLTKEGVRSLIERLPLLDKRIWLEATCENYKQFYFCNEHLVIGNSKYLKIKHATRCSEQPESFLSLRFHPPLC